MIWVEFAKRIVSALLLGTLIGAERQWRQRMAGLRTNALVCIGASLYVVLSEMVSVDSSPTRIAAAVVSGIGFLGAGVIMRQGFNIQGLNTAATLWCSAAVGVICGSGFIAEAFIGTIIVLSANILLRALQHMISGYKLNSISSELPYNLKVVCNSEDESHIRFLLLNMLSNGGIVLTYLSSEDTENPHKIEVNAGLLANNSQRQLLEQIVSRLSIEKTVSAISWKIAAE